MTKRRLTAEENELLYRALLDSSEPASPWQPIETAPKNGRDLLVWTGGRTRVAFWDTARDGVWSMWPGRELIHPTHWMPMPKPPK